MTNSALARRISGVNLNHQDHEASHREEIKEMKNMFESCMRDMFSKHQETMDELKQEMRDLKERVTSENHSQKEI